MILCALIAMMPGKAVADMNMYIGTYTDPDGSKGIYRVALNQETGALSESLLVAETVAPSYLAVSPNGKYLFAVNEYTDGEASSFAIGADGLTKLNTVTFDGKSACHLSVGPSGKWLFASAYGGGTLNVLPILEDGKLGEVSEAFRNIGTGPNKNRQEAPHMHFSAPVGGFVYACDLGTDEVLTFGFNAASGKLRLQEPRAGKTDAGAGPRHLVVRSDGKTLYADNEMTLGVSVFDRNTTTGELKLVQTVSTLPAGETAERKSTAAIRLHPKLPVLYVSNRGHNSIAIFDIEKDGKLKQKEVFALDVKEPRDFNIDSTGKWLIVAGQSSGELRTLRIDPATGLLSSTEYKTSVPKPVCIVFAP